jgi:hypothetical protein
LVKLKRLVDRGLDETGPLWEPVKTSFAWLHGAARILNNEAGLDGAAVRRRLSGLVASMTRWQHHADSAQPAVAHFLKVTRSYWPGLFHCYDVADLPRTNNDLEHVFGSYRYHERRTTGRKVASPALVLRGSVRITAAIATRQRPFSGDELAPRDVNSWKALRTELGERRARRTLQRRFRRDPKAYLDALEADLLKLILPA